MWGKVRECMLFKCFSLLLEAFAFDEWGAHRKPSKNDMDDITQASEENNLVTFTQVFNKVFTMFKPG